MDGWTDRRMDGQGENIGWRHNNLNLILLTTMNFFLSLLHHLYHAKQSGRIMQKCLDKSKMFLQLFKCKLLAEFFSEFLRANVLYCWVTWNHVGVHSQYLGSNKPYLIGKLVLNSHKTLFCVQHTLFRCSSNVKKMIQKQCINHSNRSAQKWS